MKYSETCIAASKFHLLFEPLHADKALSFPCNAQGEVPLDELSERALENYLFARAVIGHEYARPVVERCNS
jgi:hypothetical protein